MKPNWLKLKNNIPNKIRTAPRRSFPILWSDGLSDTREQRLHGITEFHPEKIIINSDQTDKEAVMTMFHEFVHALDHHNEIGLTETQVMKLEKCFVYVREFILILEGKRKNEKKE